MKEKGCMMNRKRVFAYGIFSALILLALSMSFPVSYAIEPFGATVNVTNISRAIPDAAGSDNAFAGNVSEMKINGYSITQSWQGYYGNVSGTIQLADSSDFVMYNWSATTPSGEVYASTNSSIQWMNVQCFNYTAAGNFTSDTAQAGGTSLYGRNLSQLEAQYGLLAADVDGVDETFSLSGAGTHDQFFTANRQFSEGECRNTRVYDSSGAGVSNNFEEVLLYEPATTSLIFTSIIENDVSGFNSRSSDFEMLVLENGHGTDTSSTTYYFFIELE